jgi:hypothetical protein
MFKSQHVTVYFYDNLLLRNSVNLEQALYKFGTGINLHGKKGIIIVRNFDLDLPNHNNMCKQCFEKYSMEFCAELAKSGL